LLVQINLKAATSLMPCEQRAGWGLFRAAHGAAVLALALGAARPRRAPSGPAGVRWGADPTRQTARSPCSEPRLHR